MDTRPRITRHISPYHAAQGYGDSAPLGRDHVLGIEAIEPTPTICGDQTGLFAGGPIPPEALEDD